MKKRLFIFMGLLVAMMTTIFTSCKNACGSPSAEEWTKEDSAVVKSLISEATTPMFVNCDEVLTYQTFVLNEEEEKVIFLSMKPKTLEQVTTVVLSKQSDEAITISDIVEEYLHGQDIYDRLNTDDAVNTDNNITPTSDGLSSAKPDTVTTIPHQHKK